MKPTGVMSVVTASGLQLQKSRLEFLSLVLNAMVQAKTVTASLVGMIESEAQPESLYRRAQRCF